MRLHHHVKHGVLKLVSLTKGKIRISLLILSFLSISYFAVSQYLHKGFTQTSGISQAFDEASLTAFNIHPLTSDEFAIVTKSVGEPANKKVTNSVRLSNGEIYTFDADKNTAYNVIEGNDKTITYIKMSSNVEIHKFGLEKQTISQKIDPSLKKKFRSKDTVVPVVVQLNVPFNKINEKKQTKEKGADKKAKFNTVTTRVVGKFKNKSKKKKDLQIINGISADVDEQTLADLATNPDVKKVEFDGTVKASLDTSVDQIHARDVWGLVDSAGQPLTGVGKRIAIIDTGVDYTHPDLGGCLGSTCKVIGGYDFVNNDTNPMDDMGHGTHVAATAAGKGLLNGVAPDAKIIAIKVLDAGGSGSWSQVIAGINYVVDPNSDGDTSDHADVASMSLGGSGNPDDAVSAAVDNAVNAGVTFTIAAGNAGPGASTIQSPGTARTAITVAASCKTSQIGSNSYCTGGPIASFSSRGPLIWNGVDIQKPDVAAPGVLICAARWASAFSTAPTCFDSQHVRISGTSMATPHVAGLAALILQAYPNDTPAQVKQLLKSSAHNLGVSVNDQGAGEVDAKAAIPISQIVSAYPNNWTVTSDPTIKQSSVTKSFTVSTQDPTIASLSAQYDNSVQGVAVSFSKSSLQVANGATDTFTATVTTDNDVAKPANYLARINLVANGVLKGIIPLYVTVKPTITISPITTVDYGIDNPGAASWTSDVKTFTLTNMRTDTAQTFSNITSSFPAGVTIQAPSSIAVPANGTATVDTKIVVDNTKVSNALYTGSVTLGNTTNSVSFAAKFVKFYVLTVQDTNASDLTHAYPIIVQNRNGKIYTDYSSASPRIFYVSDPGTYDVIVNYFNVYDATLGKNSDYKVFKEGIPVTDGQTTVSVSKSDAKNLVKTIPTDETGAAGDIFSRDDKITYLSNPNILLSDTYTTGGTTAYRSEVYFSNVSTNYLYVRRHVSTQPAKKVYYYYGTFTGLQGNLNFTNTPSDLQTMNVQWNINQQTGSILPLVTLWNSITTFYTSNILPLPLTQTIYELPLATPEKLFVELWNNGSLSTDVSPQFSVATSPKRWTLNDQ